MNSLRFQDETGNEVLAVPAQGVVAGWTGRDRAAIDHHIAELAAIGVAPPSKVPLFYRIAPELFTVCETIQVVGMESSGEAEPLLIDDGRVLWLGLGSDHTDRKLETVSVALSKQVCAKPVAPALWRFDALAERLDKLELRSWISDDGAAWTPYQEGTLASIQPLTKLIADAPVGLGAGRLQSGSLMLCGTLPVLNGPVRPAAFFRMELHDPVAGRSIRHGYRVLTLPEVR